MIKTRLDLLGSSKNGGNVSGSFSQCPPSQRKQSDPFYEMAPSFQEKLNSARLDISNMSELPRVKTLNHTLGLDKSPINLASMTPISPDLKKKFERANELVGNLTKT